MSWRETVGVKDTWRFIVKILNNNKIISSGTSPQYQNGNGHGGEPVPVPPGFIGGRDEQTEPVDFSTANEPVNFSSIRPVATFAGPVLAPTATGYSRESTPDSGGSHYMEAYREATGNSYVQPIHFILYLSIFKHLECFLFIIWRATKQVKWKQYLMLKTIYSTLFLIWRYIWNCFIWCFCKFWCDIFKGLFIKF